MHHLNLDAVVGFVVALYVVLHVALYVALHVVLHAALYVALASLSVAAYDCQFLVVVVVSAVDWYFVVIAVVADVAVVASALERSLTRRSNLMKLIELSLLELEFTKICKMVLSVHLGF